jgi:hypothetical protein
MRTDRIVEDWNEVKNVGTSHASGASVSLPHGLAGRLLPNPAPTTQAGRWGTTSGLREGVELDLAPTRETVRGNEELLQYFRPSGVRREIRSGTFKTFSTPFKVEYLYLHPVHRHLRQRIVTAALPEKRLREGIAPPTIDCKDLATWVAISLYDKHEILPHQIGASVEEGIILVYKHLFWPRTLAVEIYNDLQVAAVVSSSKQIRRCQTIAALDFKAIIAEFNA